MIVVDSNVILYFYLAGPFSAAAQQAFVKEPRWIAPHLWRSEVRSVLARYAARQELPLQVAHKIMREAETLLQHNEFKVNSTQVLDLAAASGCSAYDCEFVALAHNFRTALVTMDQQVLRAFPQVAVSLERFAAATS